MKKYNLKKQASAGDSTVTDKMLDKNRTDMNLSNNQQKVVEKNINLSLPIKDKDNTVPFNLQLEASRTNTDAEPSITEASMDDKEVHSDSKDKKQVMDINVKTQEYCQEHEDSFKQAEGEKNTAFWDKYVGVQLEGDGMPTKVKNNIPATSSQLPNNPARFKGKDINKMVMASIKDADAMLFHIHATAARSGRNLSEDEKQQIIDINSGKRRILAGNNPNVSEEVRGKPDFNPRPCRDKKEKEDGMVEPIRRNLEYAAGTDPVIKEESDGKGTVYEGKNPIDQFKDCAEAKANYPEADIPEQR